MSLNSEIPASPKPEVAADVEAAQAGNGLSAGNADGRVGIADPGPVLGDRLELDVAVADEQFVDRRSRERPRPVERQAQERRIVRADQIALERCPLRLGLVFLVREPTEDPIVLRQVHVDLPIALVRPLLVRTGCDEIARVARTVRQRVELLVREHRARDWAEPTRVDLIAGERLTGDRILDSDGDAGEVAAAPRFRCHRPDQFARAIAEERLVVAEEEHLVLHDRPAESSRRKCAATARPSWRSPDCFPT